MRSINYLQSKMHSFGIFGLVLLLASCGSYQYAGYEEDAIYGDTQRTVEYTETETESEQPTGDSGYYQNYFKEKTIQYSSINDENAIFTDIDSYEGSYDGTVNDSLVYDQGYGGWGQEYNDDVVINIYGGHAFNSIWWNRPPLWNNWGWGWNNWGWNNWGWHGWGWNGFGWNAWGFNNWGWNYGFGFNNGFWCPPFYGGVYAYNPWWGGGFGPYYGGFYGRRGYAFNASRRGSVYGNNSFASLSRRSAVNSSLTGRNGTSNTVRRSAGNNNVRRGSAVRTRPNTTVRTRPNSTVRGRPNTTVRGRPNNSSVRGRPTTTRPNSNYKKTRPRVNNNSRPTTRPTTRSNTRRSNNNSFSRPSSSRSRSSGFSRSSGSMRSSGSRSSGSSRRGGRQ